MATVLITGGTGLIGTRLTEMLVQKGFRVVILTRNPEAYAEKPAVIYRHWDVEKGIIDASAMADAEYLIHLAGAGVADKRWSKKRKEEIVKSRADSAVLLVKSAEQYTVRLKAVIGASGIGWYGPDAKKKSHPFEETAPVDAGFLGETCRVWEESVQPFKAMGKRLVIFRIGPALSNKGGMLKELKKPLQYASLATIFGSGEQMVSWIHIDDLCRMFVHALENEQVEGVYNAVAPTPVSNKALTLSIAGHRYKKPFIPVHVPAFVLKLMLGEMSVEVLKSATVSPTRIRATGFRFLYPSLDAAMEQLAAQEAIQEEVPAKEKNELEEEQSN